MNINDGRKFFTASSFSIIKYLNICDTVSGNKSRKGKREATIVASKGPSSTGVTLKEKIYVQHCK